jgi:hypothetical protein
MPQYNEPITSEMGGEIAEVLSKLENEEFCCKMCSKVSKLTKFIGYEHEGGIAGSSGEKYWVYWICPKCKYQWAWHKILHWISTPAHAEELAKHRK